MEQKPKYIFLNDKVVPFDDAKIHVLSVGMTYASTVFEGLRGYWNEEEKQLFVFRMEDHSNRLLESIKMVRMDSHLKYNDITGSITKLLEKSDFNTDVHIRQLVFVEGIGPMNTMGPVGLAVAAIPSYRFYDIDKGINCAVSSWRRISANSSPPRIKCTANYHNSRLASIQGKLDGYDSIIFLNELGKVCEGPSMCLFMVRKGRVITPPVSSDILESITRETTIKLLKEYHGIEVIERDMDRTELYIADELFFSGTACEITPIVSVDKNILSDGKIGDITRKIQKTYLEIVKGFNKDHPEWRTAIN
jgi:branched-chain amino acid aminotransferase